MRILKQAVAVLGTVVVIAVIVASLTPKTAHTLIASLAQVAHTLANPVPTVAAATPDTFVQSENCTFNVISADSCGLVPIYTVPAGRIAVIDSVSGDCVTGEGVLIREWTILSSGGAVKESFPNAPGIFAPVIGGTVSTFALNYKTYVSGGATGNPIDMYAFSTVAQTTYNFCHMTVSGHFTTSTSQNAQ